ncbi:Wadjet anti-phage system protein JetD domain-containing protein [Sutcliffiella horikoshii]|uniref:Wadjet anti-phage system protein JetD domain-containing protein n=1 Tax=Sutcliffiella horikoshii TaxID=79883 RepID=UPI003CEF70A7
MYRKVLEYINNHQKVNIETWDIQSALQFHSDFVYSKFADSIKRLVEEEIIEPVISSGESHHHRQELKLYKRYRKVKLNEVVSDILKKEILTMYHVKMKVSFYIRQPKQYAEDRHFLIKINQFLSSDSEDWLTVNERSFQLVQDEKWLSGNGMSLLKKVGLSLSDLRCSKIFEPFFYFAIPSWKELTQSNVLIVENKDTYGSFKELFKEGITTFAGVKFDFLIYGEGEKIISSIESIWEIDGANSKDIQGYYFGDLDPIGIEICLSLMRKNEISLKPMAAFYEELLSIYKTTRLKRKKKQKYKVDTAEEFASYLSDLIRDAFFEIIQEYYLPQEGLNKSILRSMTERN